MMLLHANNSGTANKTTTPVRAYGSWYDDESESSGCYEDEVICVATMCKKLLSQSSEATLDTMVSSSASWTNGNMHEHDEDDDSAWSWYSSDDSTQRETVVRFADEDDVLEFEPDDTADLGSLFYSPEEIDAFRQVFEQELEEEREQAHVEV